MDQGPVQIQPLGVSVDSRVGVSQTAFTTTTGIFFGVALLSVLAPTALRLRTKWTPSAEDYCLHAGAVFLSGAAGLLYSMSDNLYYLAAGAEYQTVTNPGHVDWIEAEVAVGDVTKRSEAFSILAWTSVFAVRCSLLAVSKKRCNANEHWLRQYYRGAMVVAVLSWLVCIITSPFLVCPLIVRTPRSGTCGLSIWTDTYVPISTVITAIDVLTTIAIIALELVQFSRRRFQRSLDAEETNTTTATTKPQTPHPFPLTTFFLLSLAGIAFAAVRVSTPVAATYPPLLPWLNFWQFLESCTTICAGVALSLTVPARDATSSPAPAENETAESTTNPSNTTYPTRTHTKDEKKPGWTITTWAMDRKASASTLGANDISHTHTHTPGGIKKQQSRQHDQEEDDAIGPLAAPPRDTRNHTPSKDTLTPRRPPIAYHYPTWGPQSTQDQEAVEAQMAAGQTLVWYDPLMRRASQTSFGGATLMDRRGSEQTGYARHGSVSSVRS